MARKASVRPLPSYPFGSPPLPLPSAIPYILELRWEKGKVGRTDRRQSRCELQLSLKSRASMLAPRSKSKSRSGRRRRRDRSVERKKEIVRFSKRARRRHRGNDGRVAAGGFLQVHQRRARKERLLFECEMCRIQFVFGAFVNPRGEFM